MFGLIIFFFVWAAADAIRPTPLARTVFAFVSFPVFTVSPAQVTNVYFWELAILNYLLWAVFAAWLTRRWKSE